MEFFLFAVPLAVAAGLLLAVPLWRRGKDHATRADFDVAVFRDQLAEIERDVERGLLAAPEAETARLEVQRRILAVASEKDARAARPQGGRALIVTVALAMPVLAAAFYVITGEPGMPDFPFSQRADTRPNVHAAEAQLREQIPDLDAAVERLAQRLKSEPGDLRGWIMLGRTYMTLQKYVEAAAAFAGARTAGGGTEAALQQAEALIAANPDAVTPETAKLLEEVAAAEPGSITAHYHLGLAKGQRGDFRGAAQEFADVIALSPPDAEWLPNTKEQLGFAAHEAGIRPDSLGPSKGVQEFLKRSPPKITAPTPAPAAPATAPATSADQQEMIRGMVERLAARLKENPNDADGWRMLARSYEVLGESEKAKDALAKAAALSK